MKQHHKKLNNSKIHKHLQPRRLQPTVAPQDSTARKMVFEKKPFSAQSEHEDSEPTTKQHLTSNPTTQHQHQQHTQMQTTNNSITHPTSPHLPTRTGPGTRSWLGAWGRAVPKSPLSRSRANIPQHITTTAWSTPLPRGSKVTAQWIKLIPFGIYCHPKGLQQFTRLEANEIVNYFYSLRGRISRLFRGLPIAMHNTEPCGRIVKLEVRDEGLWAFIKWNEVGQNLIKRKTTGYLTPTWLLRATHPDVFTPFKLLRVNFVRDKFAPPVTKPTPVPTPPPAPKPAPKPSEPLKTTTITKNLIDHQNLTKNRDHFVNLVYKHMKTTGQEYLQSWNTVKQNYPDLWA